MKIKSEQEASYLDKLKTNKLSQFHLGLFQLVFHVFFVKFFISCIAHLIVLLFIYK